MRIDKWHAWKGVASLTSLALLVLFASFDGTAADGREGKSYSAYLQPQRMVEVEKGRRLNLVCMGQGSPTIILDSGVAEPTSTWFLVQPKLSRYTRACSYDRAGAGFSDAETRAGNSANIVDDLKKMLVAAGIKPPYLLVGQSYGGMNARLYYYTHPEDVAGMVLIDPSHEDQDDGFRMVSPRGLSHAQWVATREPGNATRRECVAAAAHGFAPGDANYKKCVFDAPVQMPPELRQAYVDMQMKPAFHQTQLSEDESVFNESVDQLRASRRSLLNLPLVVLTRSPDDSPLRSWETPRLREVRSRTWFNLHTGLADSSSRGVLRVVKGSDHAIQLSQPDAVVQAIQEVIAVSKNSTAQ